MESVQEMTRGGGLFQASGGCSLQDFSEAFSNLVAAHHSLNLGHMFGRSLRTTYG